MNRFRDKFALFMSGRNGVDEFSRFINWVSLGFLVVSIFIPWPIPRYVLWGLGFGLLIYSYFRIFSKNYPARSRENQWFCSIKYRNRGGYNNNSYNGSYTNEQKKAMDKKTHKIFKCPNCAQKIRVPKHKGKICISCPKCRNEFIKRTWFLEG